MGANDDASEMGDSDFITGRVAHKPKTLGANHGVRTNDGLIPD